MGAQKSQPLRPQAQSPQRAQSPQGPQNSPQTAPQRLPSQVPPSAHTQPAGHPATAIRTQAAYQSQSSGYGTPQAAVNQARQSAANQSRRSQAPLSRQSSVSAAADERGFFVRKRKATSGFSALEWGSLMFIPFVFFVFTSVLFAYFYRWHSLLLWTFVICTTLLTGGYARYGFLHSYYQSAILVPFLVAGSVLAGAAVGLAAYDLALKDYGFYESAYPYVNVQPSDEAGAYVDAGMIAFADETRLDTTKALGYKDGAVYCVAPIVGDEYLLKVQFWAVGVNCCGRRGAFVCDDAWDSKARSGMVVQSDTRFDSNLRANYLLAIKQAEAAFAIASSEEPIFVRWVADPETVSSNLWSFGIGILIVASVAHLVLSCTLFGYTLLGSGNVL